MGRSKKQGDGSEGPKNRHRYRVLGSRPPNDIRAAIEALAAREERSPASMGVILWREALQARALLPAKGGGDS